MPLATAASSLLSTNLVLKVRISITQGCAGALCGHDLRSLDGHATDGCAAQYEDSRTLSRRSRIPLRGRSRTSYSCWARYTPAANTIRHVVLELVVIVAHVSKRILLVPPLLLVSTSPPSSRAACSCIPRSVWRLDFTQCSTALRRGPWPREVGILASAILLYCVSMCKKSRMRTARCHAL